MLTRKEAVIAEQANEQDKLARENFLRENWGETRDKEESVFLLRCLLQRYPRNFSPFPDLFCTFVCLCVLFSPAWLSRKGPLAMLEK